MAPSKMRADTGNRCRCFPVAATDPAWARPRHVRLHGRPDRNNGPHGGAFENQSILTDVLGWVLERAAGQPFAELFSREVWSRLGAEHDAQITIDSAGCAITDGGICTTPRDLARFGQLYLDGGGGIVPPDLMIWVLEGSQIEDRGDYLVIRSPDDPSFWWGNFLLLSALPPPGLAGEWLARFAAEFPGASHVALGVDVIEAGTVDPRELLAAGFRFTRLSVLTGSDVQPAAAPQRQSQLPDALGR